MRRVEIRFEHRQDPRKLMQLLSFGLSHRRGFGGASVEMLAQAQVLGITCGISHN